MNQVPVPSLAVPRWRRIAALALLVIAATAARADYLFTYFVGNGEDGLHLAWSSDGYHWAKLNGGKSYLKPLVGKSKLMRDPCVTQGPDGVFRLVWTAGWNEDDIGCASTRDFITWSAEKSIPVMAAEPKTRNTWAPEIDWDPKRREFLIFWASTIPGRFPATDNSSEHGYNHRIYCTTTKDFGTFTPTRLFYDPGFSVIDATILRANGKYHLIVKDETRNPPKKHLRIAEADDIEGPYEHLSPPFTPPGRWVEGPTAIKVGDDYLVYFDCYIEMHYGAMRSRDLKNWEDVTSQMSFPDENTPQRMRHGTVIEVSPAIVAKLRGPESAR
ncbi:MAG TPA: glycoside hydrolase family 43 protein [Opitutaceae bacterium]|nr:glycoside hydrolase family 43 protein [Opitutaceae bacterium]